MRWAAALAVALTIAGCGAAAQWKAEDVAVPDWASKPYWAHCAYARSADDTKLRVVCVSRGQARCYDPGESLEDPRGFYRIPWNAECAAVRRVLERATLLPSSSSAAARSAPGVAWAREDDWNEAKS